jgi:hypothetical protein
MIRRSLGRVAILMLAACHEGNYALKNILTGGRADEAK